ncbi:hypothetical protein Q5P01_001556 [Channa striata]|uniref:G-protein coupled receptors family 1 profile domain-containing protein n=1 Tax=Channa striata TaxID=64152 RepID=A0AA88T5D6_CHASR|nr:hypothetical protein Q5P01_001556 [Channa striata]
MDPQKSWMQNVSRNKSFHGNDSWDVGNSTVNPLKRNEEVAKVEVTVLVVVLLLALTGNLCVLRAIHSTKRSQSRMYYLMKHLSIADLVVAVFQVLPQLIWDITFRFYGPDFLCRLVKYLQVVDLAFIIAMLLASLNSCCNPWIYMFFAGHLFHELMHCFFGCCRRYLTDFTCSCDRQCRHTSSSSPYVIKDTCQSSVTHTPSTGRPGH